MVGSLELPILLGLLVEDGVPFLTASTDEGFRVVRV
jgi:hypothetical protein